MGVLRGEALENTYKLYAFPFFGVDFRHQGPCLAVRVLQGARGNPTAPCRVLQGVRRLSDGADRAEDMT